MDRKNEISREVCRIFCWRPAAWLHVTGTDAPAFLQGQFSKDLRSVDSNRAVYGLWLNHKGRVMADSFVLRGTNEDFWLGSYFSPARVIRERLESFIIADDVAIEDVTDEWAGLTFFGECGQSEVAEIGRETGAKTFSGRRTTLPSYEVIFPKSAGETIRARFAGATELSATEMEQERIRSGIPAIPADIGPGDLPNEGSLEADAISYTKGCYLGQEVMARLKSMGRVRRRLLRIRGRGEIPALPATLYQAGRKIGELRSAVAADQGFLGLALLSLAPLLIGENLSFSPDGAGELELTDTP